MNGFFLFAGLPWPVMILFTIALVIVLIGHGWAIVLFVVGGKADDPFWSRVKKGADDAALVDALVAWGKALAPCRSAWVATEPENAEANGFYAAHGFTLRSLRSRRSDVG